MATGTHPGPWWQEDEETVLTVLSILEDQATAAKRGR